MSAGYPTQIDQRDVPYHMTSSSATKAQGKKEEEKTFMVMLFVLPSNCYLCCGPAFQEVAHLPANGKWQRISLFCFTSAHSFCC